MPSLRRLVPPLLAALPLAALALAVSACGYSSDAKDVVEGEPVKLGDVQYNVVFSRYLNPNDNEDSAYLVGQPPPAPETTYFGVFFEVQNEERRTAAAARLASRSTTPAPAFEALASESLYAFPLGGEVEAQEQIPVLDSTPQQGPIEGSLVLFLLPDSASENRPLTLEIHRPRTGNGARSSSTSRGDARARLEPGARGPADAAGAATSPPAAPASISSTPIASFAPSAGAKAANQASLIWTRVRRVLLAGLGAELGGAGLAGDLGLGDRPGEAGAAGHHADHQFGQLVGDLLRHHPHRLRRRGGASCWRRSRSARARRRCRSSGRRWPSTAASPALRPGRSR